MERPYEQIRQMVKLFEYNRLKLRFRNEDERARFIDGWAEHFCETDDAEWNIAVTIMTARRREPNFYNMEKALREAQGIRRERRLQDEWRAKDKGSLQQDQRANNNAAEQGREGNGNNGANAQISTAAETSGGATTSCGFMLCGIILKICPQFVRQRIFISNFFNKNITHNRFGIFRC